MFCEGIFRDTSLTGGTDEDGLRLKLFFLSAITTFALLLYIKFLLRLFQ